jgi:hypothetical protein
VSNNDEIRTAINEALRALNRHDADVGLSTPLQQGANLDSLEVVELAALSARKLGLPDGTAPDVRYLETFGDLERQLAALVAAR